MKAVHWLIVPLLLCAACDWRAFNDLEKDTPVVLLQRPGSFKQGFGVSVATATGPDGSTRVVVAGAPGQSPVATYAFGADEKLGTDSVDSGGCDNSVPEYPCGVADQLAGMGQGRLGKAAADKKDLCFVLGAGRTPTLENVDGLVVRCLDRTEYTLPFPSEEVATAVLPDINGIHQPLFLATDLDQLPALLAGSPNGSLAWFYAPGYYPNDAAHPPVLIETPSGEAKQQFGSAVAVVRLAGGARLFAVAAKGSNHVWLYRSDDGTSAAPVACLGGIDGLGQALTSGDVTGDGADDLVVTDANTAYVISGGALDLQPPPAAPSCAKTLLDGAIKAACSGENCSGSGFGVSVAVGNLDGQGGGELIVGAPTMKVRKRGGAVLLYSVANNTAALKDTLFLSSTKSGDELGGTVVAAALDERSVIVAGGAGGDKAAVFFCSSLVPENLRGARCE